MAGCSHSWGCLLQFPFSSWNTNNKTSDLVWTIDDVLLPTGNAYDIMLCDISRKVRSYDLLIKANKLKKWLSCDIYYRYQTQTSGRK